MIVDAHIHIGQEKLLSSEMVALLKTKGQWETALQRLSPEGVVEALDQAGVDKGIVFPLTFESPNGPWQDLNDMTAYYVARFPRRLAGLAVIHPRQVRESLVEVERAIRQLGLKGIKVHPSMQAFYPDDQSLAPLYEAAESEGWPILIHTGASVAGNADKYSHPLHLDEVAGRYPRLQLVLAHCGRPWYQDAALILRKHANCYGDVCANVGRTGGTALLEIMLTWMKLYADGTRRLLFGSDSPVFDIARSLADLRQAAEGGLAQRLGLPGLEAEELPAILGENAARVFGLDP
jgi:hypothetical protein